MPQSYDLIILSTFICIRMLNIKMMARIANQTMFFKYLMFTTLLTWCAHFTQLISAHSDHPKLFLLSFDGFRWDYLDIVKQTGRKLPNFDRLVENGVHSSVKNTFVTKTFPNHYTIATGMYEENHGIVGNNMYDPVFEEEFVSSPEQARSPRWWNNGTDEWKGEPIWIRNERAGENDLFVRQSGVYFWPGSEVAIGGKHPTHYMKYNGSTPFKTEVDQVISWFEDDSSPINLGVMYYREPDHTGHIEGPNSNVLYDMIVELDGYVGYLLSEMENAHLLQSVNLIITSDHGMVEIKGTIYLEDYVNVTLFDTYGHSPVFNIKPKLGFEDIVYEALSAAPDLHVYKKEDIPDEYHYRNNRRVQAIVVSAPAGYDICVANDTECGYRKGNHGYNNSLSIMHPIFLAHGPAFKSGHKSKQFNNVDIYSLMCAVLDIEPAQNDGNFDNVRNVLIVHDNSTQTLITYMLVIAFAATISGIMTLAALRIQRVHKRKLIHVFKAPGMDSHAPLLDSEEDEIP